MKSSETESVYKKYLERAANQEPNLYKGYLKRLRGNEVIEPKEVMNLKIKSEKKWNG